MKVTLYVHQNFTFKLTKYGRVNIHKTLRLKTNGKIKFMVGNINKAKMKMLAERDWVLKKNPKREMKGEKKSLSLTKLIQRTLHCNFFITSLIQIRLII